MMRARGLEDQPSLQYAFATIDKNGDGFIDKRDLAALLGAEFSEDELTEMLAQARPDSEQLGFDDFKRLCLSSKMQEPSAKAPPATCTTFVGELSCAGVFRCVLSPRPNRPAVQG